uniref:Uncharacterized protein n=1 Tax=Sphaerodactylus townsendi TaxID=933632 RepID=A0ACB8G0E7_9SAUR
MLQFSGKLAGATIAGHWEECLPCVCQPLSSDLLLLLFIPIANAKPVLQTEERERERGGDLLCIPEGEEQTLAEERSLAASDPLSLEASYLVSSLFLIASLQTPDGVSPLLRSFASLFTHVLHAARLASWLQRVSVCVKGGGGES